MAKKTGVATATASAASNSRVDGVHPVALDARARLRARVAAAARSSSGVGGHEPDGAPAGRLDAATRARRAAARCCRGVVGCLRCTGHVAADACDDVSARLIVRARREAAARSHRRARRRSASSSPRASARRAAVKTTNAGSFVRPRNGSGAMNGQSVSVRMRSTGTHARGLTDLVGLLEAWPGRRSSPCSRAQGTAAAAPAPRL